MSTSRPAILAQTGPKAQIRMAPPADFVLLGTMNPPASHRSRPPAHPLVWIAQGVWMEDVHRGVSRYAHRHGWRLDDSLRFSRGPVKRPERRPDGVIAFTLGTPGLEALVKELRDEGVPVVDMEAYVDRYGAPRVLGDDRRVGELAASHLAASYPKRLYAVFRGPETPVTKVRREAFLRRAADSGIPAQALRADTFRVTDLVKNGPAGLYAGGETLALELLRECLESGVRVPEDLAILSGDDFGTVCANAPVPLSAVDLDMEEKGRLAAELLDRLMRGETPPPGPIIAPPSGIIRRASTRTLRSADETTDRLIRHLAENCHRRVDLDTLCREAGLPLRTAQHRLRRTLGTTPGRLLRDFRLRQAERMEAAGPMKKDTLARTVGYGSRSGLDKARRKAARG